jgi:hypothetical protein
MAHLLLHTPRHSRIHLKAGILQDSNTLRGIPLLCTEGKATHHHSNISSSSNNIHISSPTNSHINSNKGMDIDSADQVQGQDRIQVVRI